MRGRRIIEAVPTNSPQMGTTGNYRYHIAARDVDFTGCPALAAVTDHVLSAAGDDADRNGFGVTDLNESNLTWVLSRFCMEFVRYPARDETLCVSTWVSEVGRMMTTRNFVITAPGGDAIGAAVSNWAMIDLGTRRAVDITSRPGYAEAVVNEPSPISAPERLGSARPDKTAVRRVMYSDIDFNRHTNTLRYLGMMLDMLPLEYMERGTDIRRMDMNFLHESRYGDTLTVAWQKGDKQLFEIRRGDQTVCRAQIEWKQ